MATSTAAPLNMDPVEIADRALNAVNDLYYKVNDIAFELRNLDMRIDNITPSTVNYTVVPTSKVVVAGVIVGAALGGYIAYVEVTRRLKQNKQTQ